MVVPADWLALSLGVIALVIAVWDHVADTVLIRVGKPVAACDCPPKVEHTGSVPGPPGKRFTVRWHVKNRLSYPIHASFVYGPELPAEKVRRGKDAIVLGGDLIGRLDGTTFYLPPRQPMWFWFQVEVDEDTVGTFVPAINLAPSGKRIPVRGKPTKVG